MFKKLVNEASLTFRLQVDGPLLINSGNNTKINPTLPDMSFVRCHYNGDETVYLPGSSLKGVFRTRFEQMGKALNKPVCNIIQRNQNCSNAIQKEFRNERGGSKDGRKRYLASCFACRLFGNLELGSRVTFSDAYPTSDSKIVMGMRNGVAIDRITGAASGGALYDLEVVESGTFQGTIHVTNFALYQLRLILWILQDIDEGFVTLGMGGSRGNGKMCLEESETTPNLVYRLFGNNAHTGGSAFILRGYNDTDLGGELQEATTNLLGVSAEIAGLNNILSALCIEDLAALQTASTTESWDNILIDQIQRR